MKPTTQPPLHQLFPKSFKGWESVSEYWEGGLFDLNGTYFMRGQPLYSKELPVVLTSVPAVDDLIPQTAWGANLHALLSKASWEAIKTPLMEQSKGICRLCGNQSRELELHELWEYQFPSKKLEKDDPRQGWGVQRFKGFLALCQACHHCFHLSYAETNGKLEDTHQRLMALNNWNKGTLKQYCKVILERWETSNRFHWLLDLQKLPHPQRRIEIRAPWESSKQDSNFIEAHLSHQSFYTAIIGIEWKLAYEKIWRNALHPPA